VIPAITTTTSIKPIERDMPLSFPIGRWSQIFSGRLSRLAASRFNGGLWCSRRDNFRFDEDRQ
jgi:hypothetical protein